MNTTTCKDHPYFLFQWELCPIVGCFPDTGTLGNEKVTIFTYGEIFDKLTISIFK